MNFIPMKAAGIELAFVATAVECSALGAALCKDYYDMC